MKIDVNCVRDENISFYTFPIASDEAFGKTDCCPGLVKPSVFLGGFLSFSIVLSVSITLTKSLKSEECLWQISHLQQANNEPFIPKETVLGILVQKNKTGISHILTCVLSPEQVHRNVLSAAANDPIFGRCSRAESARRKRFSQSVGTLNFEELAETESSSPPQKKRLRVAIVGRPNAGKSTLINRILDLNVCDVSPKTHTTRRPLKTAITRGDTQIVFVDTPGMVTKKEFSRFELSDAFLSWKERVLLEADIVGIIHEVTSPKDVFKLHINLVQSINDMPEAVPMFIILNKIDLVIDKAGVSKAITAVTKPTDVHEVSSKLPNVWNKFSKVFLISALKNVGVEEVTNFLMEQAKPGDWLFQPSVVCDKPLHILVTDLLRAQIMEILPHEVPYKCTYQVEYMKENDLGEVICVALIKCQQEKHLRLLVERRKTAIKTLSKKLESDLYKIVGKVFRLRIVACSNKKKSERV